MHAHVLNANWRLLTVIDGTALTSLPHVGSYASLLIVFRSGQVEVDAASLGQNLSFATRPQTGRAGV